MALLAVIDVDEAATPKIKNVKGAMEDLVATTVRAAQTIKDSSAGAAAAQIASLQAVQQAIQAQSVAAQQSAQAQAQASAQQAAQAAAAAQAQATAVTQAAGEAAAAASQRIQQLTAQQLAQAQASMQAAAAASQVTTATLAQTAALQQQNTVLEAEHRLVLQQAASYATLHKQLQSGATVTDAQAKLFKTLSDSIIYAKGTSVELSAEMIRLQQAIQGGARITPELAKRLQEAGQAAGYLAPQLKNVGDAGQTANKGMDAAIGGSAKLAAGLSVATAGLYAFLRGSVELAARVETLGVVTEIIARNTGQSTIVMLAQVESMKKLGITSKESYDSVIKLSQAQIDLANASKLARASQDLAVVANENSSETLQRLIRYIQSGNSELIKNLGIIASQDAIYRQYASTVGKTVAQLDQFDKKQANLNFVLQESAKFTGTYERSLDTAGKQMSSLTRYVEESRLALGEGLMPIFGKLIELTTQFLKWWLSLPPAFQNVIASAGLTITVITTLLAAMAVGKWIGIAEGIQSLVAAFTAARVAGATFGAATTAMLGPLGIAIVALAVAIGVAAGAWNYFAAETRLTNEELTKSAAKAQSVIETIETQKAVIESLGPVTTRTAAENERLAYAVAEIARVAPGAAAGVNTLSGSYTELTRRANDAIESQRQVLLTLRNVAKEQADTAGKTEQAQAQRLQEAVKRAAVLEEEIRIVKAGGQVMRESTQATNYGTEVTRKYAVSLGDLQAELKRTQQVQTTAALASAKATTEANEARQKQFDIEVTLPQFAADVQKRASTEIQAALRGDMKQYDNLAERAKVAGTSIEKLASSKNLIEYRERLSDINTQWQAHLKKVEADAKKYATAFDSMIDKIRGTATATRAQFAAVDKGLTEAGRGTEEYNRRLIVAADVIKQVGKAPAAAVASLNGLRQAFEDLEQVEFDEWAQKTTDQLDKLGLAASESMNKVSMGLSKDITAMFREMADDEIDLRRDTLDQIEELDRSAYEDRVVAKMDAVDREVYQEQRRVAEIAKSVEREIEARNRVQVRAERIFEDKVRQAQEETRELARQIQLQMDLRIEQSRLEAEMAAADGKITKEQLASRLSALDEMRTAYRASVEEMRNARLEEIDDEAAIGRERLDQQRRVNDELAAAQRAAVERTRAASQENIRDIRASYDVLNQISLSIVDAMGSGLLDIVRQADSTSDLLVGIVKKMADSVLSVIDDMISSWLKKAARLAMEDGGFNWGKFLGGGGNGGGGWAQAAMGLGGAASSQIAFTQVGGGAAGTLASTQIGGYAPLAGAGLAKGGGTGAAGAGAGGYLAAAGGGYLAGNLLSSKFADGSYLKGTAMGAGSGAATGAMIGTYLMPGLGTGVGAGVGAIAGAIGGWMAARKQRKEMEEDRKTIIEQAGGLDELKKRAEEANISLEKFLDTKKPSDYAKEVEKISKAFAELDKKKLIDAAGGMDEIVRKAKEVGIDVSEGFKNGTQSVQETAAELEKLATALELRDARKALAPTISAMDELKKRAQLAGVDVKKLFETQDLEEFNREHAKLNEALAEQQLRMEGLSRAAQGAGLMAEGLVMKLDKIAKAQGEGFDPKSLSGKDRSDAQQQFNAAGTAITATFGGVLRETGSISAALESVAEPLEKLGTLAKEFGFEMSTPLRYLNELRATVVNNEDVATSLDGIVEVVKGLGDAGRLTEGVFNEMGHSAAISWQTMEERGVAADQALLLMQPTIQALYEAQKNFGFATDETTQNLINMGVEQGLVGDQFQDVSSKMLDMLMIIAEALGGDIPEAYRKQKDAATEANSEATRTAKEAEQATKDAQNAVKMTAEEWEIFKRKIRTGADTSGIDDVAGAFDGVTNAADAAARAANDWAGDMEAAAGRAEGAVNAVSFGRSPGGLKEIAIKSREGAAAVRIMSDSVVSDTRRMENAARDYAARAALDEDIARVARGEQPRNPFVRTEAAQDESRGGEPQEGAPAASGPIIIENLTVVNEFQISTMDTTNFADSVRNGLGAALIAEMEGNTDQLTIKMGDALNRYFGTRGTATGR